MILQQVEAVVRALDRAAVAAGGDSVRAASRLTRGFWLFLEEERPLLRRYPSLTAQQALSQVSECGRGSSEPAEKVRERERE